MHLLRRPIRHLPRAYRHGCAARIQRCARRTLRQMRALPQALHACRPAPCRPGCRRFGQPCLGYAGGGGRQRTRRIQPVFGGIGSLKAAADKKRAVAGKQGAFFVFVEHYLIGLGGHLCPRVPRAEGSLKTRGQPVPTPRNRHHRVSFLCARQAIRQGWRAQQPFDVPYFLQNTLIWVGWAFMPTRSAFRRQPENARATSTPYGIGIARTRQLAVKRSFFTHYPPLHPLCRPQQAVDKKRITLLDKEFEPRFFRCFRVAAGGGR